MDKYKLTDAEHQQIMEAWRATYVPYRKLLERYETYLKSIATYNRKKKSSQAFKMPAKFSHWTPKDRKNSKQELRMQRPTRTVRVPYLLLYTDDYIYMITIYLRIYICTYIQNIYMIEIEESYMEGV